MLQANEDGLEVHCRRCRRRWVVPFAELKGKRELIRFMNAWRAREKRA